MSQGAKRGVSSLSRNEKMSRHNPKLLCSDAGQEPRSVLASFEAHLSLSDIGDMLAVEEGKRVPVEQGKMVPRYLLTRNKE